MSDWTPEKKVNLGLVLVVLVHVFSSGWWLGSHETRLSSLENWRTQNQTSQTEIAVLKEKLTNIEKLLEKWDKRLESTSK